MFAKFTSICLIACFAASACASPVPIAAPEAIALGNTELFAREALPIADAFVEREATPETEDVEARICRYGCL
ncbi:hypothetical protein K503DRAFT_800381 [Rhizopogon vinicolor AM-OR11-026]|uniref:Uncharacterized protein n=1 Tax=Rhizopogon vinicolor AM-OR11-026 TaxID=1314800 RepID=A0A1B7N0W1_9AGAM|nr:hypothetical protein K503DRAFT_800381 [Rhizopogon vinicolor AM-OR11-026]